MQLRALEVDHFALPIFNVAASCHFYGELLGLPLIAAHRGDDWGGHPWLMLIYSLGDSRQLALCALRGAERAKETLPKDVRHFAFSVGAQPELAAWKARLGQADVPFFEEDHGTQQSLYFEDPNGIMLELTTKTTAPQQVDPGAAQLVDAWLAEQRAG